MEHVVVAVFDSAAMTFGKPVFVAAVGQAIRSFQDEVGRAEAGNVMHDHPTDFALYLLASFDDQDGTFKAESPARCLIRGADIGGAKAP